jgi:cyanophycin synthetase
MRVVDSWRLFGPNVQTEGPAALVELAFDREDNLGVVVEAVKREVESIAASLGLVLGDFGVRSWRDGAAITVSAPLDILLPVTDILEWAALRVASSLAGGDALPLEPRRTELAAALTASRRPALGALEAEAAKRAVPFLYDDDEGITLGHGARSHTYALGALPDVTAVPWSELGAIPVALVTGTNGKTTTARLLARILSEGGHRVGLTTTDGVSVGSEILEEGDFTGPSGAGQVLRHAGASAAVLETARGGILRRGLAVRAADVAILTNVSDDHLGHYGVADLEALARVKAVTASVVRPSGTIVVNADDACLMAATAGFAAPRVVFSTDESRASWSRHVAAGHEAWTVAEDGIVRVRGGVRTRIAAVADIPITFGGAAPYNVENALAAAAAAAAMGVSDGAIAAGLLGFDSSARDNPGRGNLTRVGGVDVLLDFGHNPEGIRSVLGLVSRLRQRAGRLAVVAGYAGDRSNESARDAAHAIFQAHPARVWLRDLAGYLRGRDAGEMPALLRNELVRLGQSGESVAVASSEAEAVRDALAWAKSGDFIVVLVHLKSREVGAVLAQSERGA